MDQRVSRRFGFVAALAVALSLGGCGRKGPLEMPNSTTPTPPIDALANRILPPQDSPGLVQPPNRFQDRPASEKMNQATQNPSKPINQDATKTDKPFFLDPLL